ncbi:hypothetical protein [Halobacillus litoralis]|uniref:Uncharacterized protein n=1 Tax=Halobacillus litoralis TaxID=45668 RepID=A0A410MJ94_9BACI|nr:hypothetical protein [Halobacillus litoralis]QAS54746.1 hypothetical protein HLI_21045 [Halobacillus litoralis]
MINDFDKDTCESILDTAKVKYIEEQERFKLVEVKNNISLAFNGVILGIYLKYLESFQFLSSDSLQYLVYTLLIKLLILVLLTLSINKFLKSITSANFQQIGLDDIIDTEFAKQNSSISNLQIASTYKEAIDKNKNGLNMKLAHYNKGLAFLKLAFIIFVIHFVIEEVLSYV